MARKRMIDPGIWRNKGILRVSRDARLLFIGLITYADDCGYGDADPMALRASVFPGDSDISDTDLERLCNELVTAGLAELQDGLYKLPGWGNFQKLRSDYVLDDKYKQRWNGAVTDPVRTRNGPEPQVSKVSKEREEREVSKERPARKKPRTRADTPCEKRFKDGFREQYDQTCEIIREHAIALNRKISIHGEDVVKRKIDDWWTCELPDSFKGRRTIGAFVRWFDQIEHREVGGIDYDKELAK